MQIVGTVIQIVGNQRISIFTQIIGENEASCDRAKL